MFTSGAVVALMLVAAADQPCTTSAPQVVDDIYKQVLERPADPASAPFSYALGSGGMTVRDIVVRVAQSAEHLQRFFWQPLVNDVYKQTLRRAPTPQEQQAAMGQLANGMKVQGLVAQIAIGAASNEEQAVQILYRQLLGRDPDPEGFRANVALARQNGINAVVRSMMSSPEYHVRSEQAADADEDARMYAAGVRMMYRHLLNRAPDPGGLEAMTELAAVYDLREVAHRIATSPEYSERWGDQVVPGPSGVRFCGATGTGGRQPPPPPRRAIPRP
jgi:hypothetical protein